MKAQNYFIETKNSCLCANTYIDIFFINSLPFNRIPKHNFKLRRNNNRFAFTIDYDKAVYTANLLSSDNALRLVKDFILSTLDAVFC